MSSQAWCPPAANGKIPPEPEPHEFRILEEDHFELTGPGFTLDFDRIRRERNELVGELTVRCSMPELRHKTVDGVLTMADFNVSSLRSRSEYWRALHNRTSELSAIDWEMAMEELSQKAIAAARTGNELVDLSDGPDPEADADEYFEFGGIVLPKHNPAFAYGDGGTLKSYIMLWVLGNMAIQGMQVAYVDWELTKDDHIRRLLRLFGRRPPVKYIHCDKPLVHEVEDLRRKFRQKGIEYAVFDHAALACDGSVQDDDVTCRYFRALRQLGVGSLTSGHIVKNGPDADKRPFGSVFWWNNARKHWLFKLEGGNEESDEKLIGLYNRKANLDAISQATALRVSFDGRHGPVTIERSNPADSPELSIPLPVWRRMQHALKRAAMTVPALAEELNVDQDAIRKALQRDKRGKQPLFIRIYDNLIGLAETRHEQ